MSESIYVEILMNADMEKIWQYTQTPDVHARWDLRFSTIEYLPRSDVTQAQQFLYTTRIGFGMTIRGMGETVGSREDSSDCRTSALKFWSEDRRSLIWEGSGYWQYVPMPNGIRFLTQYNYKTRFGRPGYWLDRLIFRPLLGWATAWSFDRLRLWLEKDIAPAVSLERSLLHILARAALAVIWMYQGAVPKLLFHDTGELAILQHSRLFSGYEGMVLSLVGIAEVFFGGLLVWKWRSRFLLWLNIALLVGLGAGALLSQPRIFVAPFNPLTLNLAMTALALIGLITAHDLPTARMCLRRRQEKPA